MEFPRENIHGGAKFEDVAGYARIAVAGPFAFVSGTTAVTPEGTVHGEGDAYAQAKYIFDKLVTLLEKNGIKKEEVVKVNIWTTDVSKKYGHHKSIFGIFYGNTSCMFMDRSCSFEQTKPDC